MASVLMRGQNALFLHLPKTAGHSISSALAEQVPGAEALPVRGMRRLVGASRHMGRRLGGSIYADTFSFAVVRNPWDWAVSGWKHVTENTDAYPDEKPDFASFMQGGWRRGLRRNPNPRKFASPEMFVRYHCFVTQWDHLRAGVWGGPVPLAFTARFEHLERDWSLICERIGVAVEIPHKNQSRRASYQHYYTDELVGVVARMNAPLIARFGYEFHAPSGKP